MSSTKPSSQAHSGSFPSKYRVGKGGSWTRRSFRRNPTSPRHSETHQKPVNPPDANSLTSAVVTIRVGPDKRLFAAHESVLCVSPFFAAYCRSQCPGRSCKRIDLPEEQPEVFSSVLEYLYRGDYYPKLLRDEYNDTWELEDAGVDSDGQSKGAAIFLHAAGAVILKDTAVYCSAEKYRLPGLKRVALRKQGLHSGIQCSTILTSARFAYANTPDTDSKLRAHYLALIIRSRSTFKHSGTMQMEMEQGGKLFFDLFVAMCNHMDDIAASKPKSFLPAIP